MALKRGAFIPLIERMSDLKDIKANWKQNSSLKIEIVLSKSLYDLLIMSRCFFDYRWMSRVRNRRGISSRINDGDVLVSIIKVLFEYGRLYKWDASLAW